MPGCASFDDGIHFANHSVLKLDISSVFMVVWITVTTGWVSKKPWLTVYPMVQWSPMALTVVNKYKMPWLFPLLMKIIFRSFCSWKVTPPIIIPRLTMLSEFSMISKRKFWNSFSILVKIYDEIIWQVFDCFDARNWH